MVMEHGDGAQTSQNAPIMWSMKTAGEYEWDASPTTTIPTPLHSPQNSPINWLKRMRTRSLNGKISKHPKRKKKTIKSLSLSKIFASRRNIRFTFENPIRFHTVVESLHSVQSRAPTYRIPIGNTTQRVNKHGRELDGGDASLRAHITTGTTVRMESLFLTTISCIASLIQIVWFIWRNGTALWCGFVDRQSVFGVRIGCVF